jgi:hypothetical protein
MLADGLFALYPLKREALRFYLPIAGSAARTRRTARRHKQRRRAQSAASAIMHQRLAPLGRDPQAGLGDDRRSGGRVERGRAAARRRPVAADDAIDPKASTRKRMLL